MKRMNIVFAFADDWGKYASAYAPFEGPDSINSLISTPNFDRIAREGALFQHAFVPAPSCTPCRSSVLSGRYFWQTGLGAVLDGAVWDESIETYPLELERSGGYFLGHTYKVWSPGVVSDAPYGGLRTAYNRGGIRFGLFSHEVTARGEEIGIEAAKQELYDEVALSFSDFLEKRPAGRPFCYWWGPTNTHRSWERGSGKRLWGIDPDSLKGKLPDFLPDVHEIRQDFADYLGEVQAFDAGLGVILRKLEEAGELDNTLFVVSGDHGIPGFPRAKCNVYDFGQEVALAVRWPGKVKPGRVIDDLVNIMDLAPTFLEAAGVAVPSCMTAKSLLPLLLSEKSGQVDPSRTFVVTGRERHAQDARPGGLPYPMRGIRTEQYLYIVNFEPDRWPMGDPLGLDDPNREIPFSVIRHVRYATFTDCDAGPTKAWMCVHRNDEDVRPLFDLAMGKRPYEELYDLENDRYYMRNVAGQPEYAQIKQQLRKRLFDVLTEQQDPRVTETPCRFEAEPYAGPSRVPFVSPGVGVWYF